MIVADTNIVSEMMKPLASPAVVRWFDDHARGSISVTAPGLAELWFGIDNLPAGKRREMLEQSLNAALGRLFAAEILALDGRSARLFGQVCARRRSIGRPITTVDAMIAAICIANGAALATRNARDFEGLDLDVINPFEAG